jgi:hypothetical protein
LSLEQLILLLVAIFLVFAIFYVSASIVASDWSADGSLVLRLLIVALIAVFVIPFVRNLVDDVKIGELGLLFAFILLVVVTRYVLVDELPVSDDWLASLVISLLGVLMIYAVDEIAQQAFNVEMLSLI